VHVANLKSPAATIKAGKLLPAPVTLAQISFQLLVYRRWLHNSFLSESDGRLDPYSLAQTIS
jgi:hypothetical protein